MKKLTIILFTMFSIITMQSQAYAASSEVTWTDYENYRDIRPGNEGRKHFRERTFSEFEKHFNKLAEQLPQGQVLKIEVTDVDLAGDTNAGGINRIRIVKEIYSPRMNFSYQLVNSDGSVIKEDKVELKDMNFMMGNNMKYRHESLGYEKKMLDEWFSSEFKELRVDK